MGAHRGSRRALPGTRATRRTAVGLAVVPLVSGVAACLLPAPSASASDVIIKPVTVTSSNWYWNKLITIPALPALPVPLPVSPPALPDTPLPIPDGILVPNGDLAVSSKGEPSGEPDRETYLSFSLGGAKPGATVKAFSFTLTIDKSNLTNTKLSTVPLIACFPSRFWDPGKGGQDFSQKPQDDCNGAPEGKYDAAKQTYTFNVASFAKDWVDGSNLGVSIRQAKSQTTPFILAFTGPKTVKGTISYVAGLPEVPVVAVAPVVDAVTPQEPVTTTTDVVGSTEGSIDIPKVPTATLPGVTVAPNTFTAASGNRSIGATTFDSRFWSSSILGIVAIALLGWFVGRRPVAAGAVAARPSRLSQVLSARVGSAASVPGR